MQVTKKKRFYTPQFSPFASVSVRRLAWSFGKSMPKTMDMVIRFLPFFFDRVQVCAGCRDKTKCSLCAFDSQVSEQDFLSFLATK